MAPTRREFIKKAGITGILTTAIKKNRPGYVFAQTPNEVKQIEAGVLSVAYEEYGATDGFPIILVHGFPYDVRSFDGVSEILVNAGYRVLLPYLRGYGQTWFLDDSGPRMAEQAAIAQDLIDFADALNIGRFAAAGFDWGNRAICIAAILYPHRIAAQVACGGYSVQDTISRAQPAPAVECLARARRWL